MASKYHTTLVVASALVILFGEMWKFSNNSFYKEQIFVKDNREYFGIPKNIIISTGNFQN
jgi:hypothetical protein